MVSLLSSSPIICKNKWGADQIADSQDRWIVGPIFWPVRAYREYSKQSEGPNPGIFEPYETWAEVVDNYTNSTIRIRKLNRSFFWDKRVAGEPS